MKKIVCTAVSALALAAFADGVNSTEFGVMQVPSSAKETIVSVPWLESGTGSENVKVADLVLTAGLNEGDTLSLFGASDYTASWRLNAQKKWVSDQSEISSLPRGNALKLTRANPGAGFYIMGKPATAGVKTTLGTGYSLVAPPSTTETDLNETTVITWENINQNDKIMVPNKEGTSVVTYSYVKGKWSKWDQKTFKWITTGITIPAGMGAWFVNSGTGSNKSFTYGTVSAE